MRGCGEHAGAPEEDEGAAQLSPRKVLEGAAGGTQTDEPIAAGCPAHRRRVAHLQSMPTLSRSCCMAAVLLAVGHCAASAPGTLRPALGCRCPPDCRARSSLGTRSGAKRYFHGRHESRCCLPIMYRYTHSQTTGARACWQGIRRLAIRA
jgi:hypothetical protein